jgi:hypothetical protein
MAEANILVDAMFVRSTILSPVAEGYLFRSFFDMDGTLVSSTQGVVGAWETFGKTYPTIDIPSILTGAPYCVLRFIDVITDHYLVSHGVRTVENLRKHCGIEDPEELNVRSLLLSFLQ